MQFQIVFFFYNVYSDHCGALPYFTEMCGYDGPIYMTHPTKAICPILLEDFRKIQVERRGDSHFFTSQNIKDCMKKVVPVTLHQVVQVKFTIKLCMFKQCHSYVMNVRTTSFFICYGCLKDVFWLLLYVMNV